MNEQYGIKVKLDSDDEAGMWVSSFSEFEGADMVPVKFASDTEARRFAEGMNLKNYTVAKF